MKTILSTLAISLFAFSISVQAKRCEVKGGLFGNVFLAASLAEGAKRGRTGVRIVTGKKDFDALLKSGGQKNETYRFVIEGKHSGKTFRCSYKIAQKGNYDRTVCTQTCK